MICQPYKILLCYNMDQEEYEKKYHKYLTKNKLMLKQLRRYDGVDEQEVRFIAITITNLNSEKENKILSEIFDVKNKKNFCVLRTLNYVKSRYLKYVNLKKKHYGIKNIVEEKYNQLNETLEQTLTRIRGNNTILNFDLSYLTSVIEFDEISRKNHIKQIYILEILAPTEDKLNMFGQFGKLTSKYIPWSVDEHDSHDTLGHKWLSDNASWKYDTLKQVWITNDARPWYFENFPSDLYVKSTYEWNNILSEVVEHEKIKQRVLLNAKVKHDEQVQRDNNSLYNIIKGFLFSPKVKIHITNDETNSHDDKSIEETAKMTDPSIT